MKFLTASCRTGASLIIKTLLFILLFKLAYVFAYLAVDVTDISVYIPVAWASFFLFVFGFAVFVATIISTVDLGIRIWKMRVPLLDHRPDVGAP